MTYSIVARDPETGELGVAVQSRAFGTGGAVPWAAPGVGAVATQSFTERSYGPLGLELMRAGKTAGEALAALLTADADREIRQVAMVDAEGRAAAHTGAECIASAGHLVAEGFTVQGNIMESERVWPALAEAFEAATGSLPWRLLLALDAAEAAGGDWRGRQAAGLLVVPAEGQPWERVSDLRVDDHPDPLGELRRLLRLEEGYRAQRRTEERAAAAAAGGLSELDVVWARVLDAAHAGDLERARGLLRPLLEEEPRWAHYARALGARGVLPRSEELLDLE